jgi:hypothetical protein
LIASYATKRYRSASYELSPIFGDNLIGQAATVVG